MRSLSPTLALVPLLLPAIPCALAGELSTPWYPTAAENCGKLADEVMESTQVVDATLSELGIAAAPAGETPDHALPEVAEGQSAAVSDGGMFFDAANSRLAYLGNVRLNDARVKLRAAHRLYVQLPKEETDDTVGEAGKDAFYPTTAQDTAKTKEEAETTTAAPEAPQDAPAPPPVPLEITTYDALVDTVSNRMMFTTGPGAPQLIIRQGGHELLLSQKEGGQARVLADEEGNLLMQAPVIHMQQQEEDGSKSHFYAGGGRAFYHAASRTLVLEGPVDVSYRNGESSLKCSQRLCLTLQEEEAAPKPGSGFMEQFTSMRFSGVAAASATGAVQLFSRNKAGDEVALCGDALHYNGRTGEIEIPGNPVVQASGDGSSLMLKADGGLVMEADGDILMSGSSISGDYVRPSRTEGAAPLRGTLNAKAPLSFHAATGTVSTRALKAQDNEASFSCTGAVQLTLTPRPEAELGKLPPREKVGMLNLAVARYSGVASLKAAGQVRAHMLDASAPDTHEAAFTASQLVADALTGEVQLTGHGEEASIAFRGYSLAAMPGEGGGNTSVHLLPNGDIDARGARVRATIPGAKGMTTLDCDNVAHLARESRLLNLGAHTTLRSPEGIVTTRGPLVAMLAAAPSPRKPLSPRYPQLAYDFAGIESAETGEGATVQAPQGSMQCSGQFSILMDRPGMGSGSTFGGIRSALATGQVALAAKDAQGRLMRASGDRLEVNGATGDKRLTGRRVVLEDANNRHEASGAGAAITIDARNNARISGERHTTSATGIHKQVEQGKKIINNTNTKD